MTASSHLTLKSNQAVKAGDPDGGMQGVLLILKVKKPQRKLYLDIHIQLMLAKTSERWMRR